MSEHSVVNAIKALTQIHDELLQTSRKKTDILKKGETDALQTILATEWQLTRKLEQSEKRRQQAVNEWFDNHAAGEEATVTKMLEHLFGEKRRELEQTTVPLVENMAALKQQEQLNLSLLQQSMALVQLSLDMLQPSLTKMNYGQQIDTPSRSVFDSKA